MVFRFYEPSEICCVSSDQGGGDLYSSACRDVNANTFSSYGGSASAFGAPQQTVNSNNKALQQLLAGQRPIQQQVPPPFPPGPLSPPHEPPSLASSFIG